MPTMVAHDFNPGQLRPVAVQGEVLLRLAMSEAPPSGIHDDEEQYVPLSLSSLSFSLSVPVALSLARSLLLGAASERRVCE